jgi:putative acetyltransferase
MNQHAANIVVRHAEPTDAEAIRRVFSAPQAIAGALQLPFPSLEQMRKRVAAQHADGGYSLVACACEEVVGSLGLSIPANPRRRHVGQVGMAVRDDWQGKGVGTALMTAALDLADNWLNLRRIKLEVYIDNAAGIAL